MVSSVPALWERENPARTRLAPSDSSVVLNTGVLDSKDHPKYVVVDTEAVNQTKLDKYRGPSDRRVEMPY